MTTILGLLAVLVVLFVAAVVATREGPVLAEAVPDAADVGLPEGTMSAEDVSSLRFAMAPRGYRMSEVDETLDRVAAELADRDRRIALLEATIEGGEEPQTQDVREADAADLPLPAAGPVMAVPTAEPVPAAESEAAATAPAPAPPAPAPPAPETAPVTPAPADRPPPVAPTADAPDRPGDQPRL